MEQFDYTIIKSKVEKVLAYSQNIENPQVDDLMDNWAKNKAHFMKKFGGPIYEVPEKVIFTLDKKSKEDLRTTFCDKVYGYSDSMSEWLELNKEGFYINKTVIEYRIPMTDIVIKEGSKIGRAMTKFIDIDDCNADTIAQFQIEYSMILQQNKVEGTLCFSVHPLDFLSLSENQHNWRSCHALDGDYRVGNTSYLQDNCTIIAYLKSDNDVILPRFPDDVPWNNKKWRALLFFDKENGIVWTGRQYPFFSDSALNICWDILKKSFHFFDKYTYSSWMDTWGKSFEECNGYELNKRHIVLKGNIYPVDALVNDAKDSRHYNDLLYSTSHQAYYRKYKNNSIYSFSDKCKPITIGYRTKCIDCGKNITFDSDTFLCDRCLIKRDIEHEGLVRCEACGRLITEDEGNTSDGLFGFETLCDDCYNAQYRKCAICGESINIDNAIYNEEKDEYYHEDCWLEEN